MRYVASYLLAVLGGNAKPSARDIKRILGSVGIEANDEHLDKVVGELSGKNIDTVIGSGLSRLAAVPAGGSLGGGGVGGGVGSATGNAVSAAASKPAEEAKKDEKKEDSSESDDDMGFGLFD